MTLFAFVKRRSFLLLIGFLLIAIFIWYAGPYFAFADYSPLETETARLIAISMVVVCWAAFALLRRLRARRADDKLVGAVLKQPPPEKERPSAEVMKLRERFDEAVATLQQQRRGGHSLYDLPWYVFIGAPGSGKTTALLNSGLKFPLEQRIGKGALRGVGGTRNCDWWFTDEAVFLDTAGRYTTQDSDATSDSEGWGEFLELLSKYRARRPLNGVILTISAQDLMAQGDGGREAHVEAARRRLSELTRHLRIELPVYLMVTKCDMVAGFTEYFDDLPLEGRAQVWGVTFPYDQTLEGEAPGAFPAEFDALMGRLNNRLFARLEAERGARHRATVFAFPQQMAGLRDPLTSFVSDVFTATRLDKQILLRGVYFTSGTQDGTQIDRLLGAIGRRFGIAAEAVAPPPGRGKAYFVERLLRHVVIGESGLAGVNRRLEVQKAAWQLGAYAAIVLVTLVGVGVWSVSYANNRTYVAQVAADVDSLRRVPLPVARASSETTVPRLDAVRAVVDSADRYRDDTPWMMRWGLYQGTSVGNAARGAYQRELDGILLPRFAARVKQRLIEHGSEPEKAYLYLKAYLMLGEPKHLDKKYLQFLADLEWKPADGLVPATETPLSTHFQSLLQYGQTLRPVALDRSLVARARSTIGQASIAKIVYGELQRRHSNDGSRLQLDLTAGSAIEQVIRRKSGRRVSEPLLPLYTKETFRKVTSVGMAPLLKDFSGDNWVWGTEAKWGDSARLANQVIDLYERDYNREWDALLSDLEIMSFPTVKQYADALGILSGPMSPLRGILKVVVENTSFVSSPEAAQASPSIATRITEGAADILRSTQTKLIGIPPGTAITAHFQPIHRLMSGSPAPIDGILEQVRKIREQLTKLGDEVGGASPLKALSEPALIELRRAVQQDAANLPAPVGTLVGQIAQNSGVSVSSDATTELEKLYNAEIVPTCHERIEGRYPFGNGNEVLLEHFGEVFGYGGTFDKFFTENLDRLVDRTQTKWTWRQGSVEPPPGMLDRFQQAALIRDMFFSGGSKVPKVNFTVTLSDLDSQALRFYFEIDGQRAEVKPGSVSTKLFVWPSPGNSSVALATFEDNVAAPVQAGGRSNQWAWFSLMDSAQLEQPQSEADLRTVFRFKTSRHSARVTVEASSATTNPFTRARTPGFAGYWREFRCRF